MCSCKIWSFGLPNFFIVENVHGHVFAPNFASYIVMNKSNFLEKVIEFSVVAKERIRIDLSRE
jgi:hypothetical protein